MPVIDLPDPTTRVGKKIQNVLRPGEDIISAVKTNSLGRNVLIATPFRVIIIKHSSLDHFTLKISSYPYSTITKIIHERAPGIGTNYVQFNAIRGTSDDDYYSWLEEIARGMVKNPRSNFEPWAPNVFLYSTHGDRPQMVYEVLEVITQHLSS